MKDWQLMRGNGLGTSEAAYPLWRIRLPIEQSLPADN
jgi:hypothetical protein